MRFGNHPAWYNQETTLDQLVDEEVEGPELYFKYPYMKVGPFERELVDER